MARTALTVNVAPGAYSGASSLDFEAASSDTGSDGNKFSLTGAEIVIIRLPATATGAATGYDVHLNSVSDPFGRGESTANILTVNITSGAHKVIGPMKLTGWQQSDGKFYLDAGSSLVEFAIVKIPGL